MANVVVVGMQWGDEGKGKMIDLLCPAFDAVVRFQGGNNAGHTVKYGSGEGNEHFALHLIPSGILHEGVACYLGNGMVIDPDAFLEEVAQLERRGIDVGGRLRVSDRAHALTPKHVMSDREGEAARGDGRIGTTAKGIGPAYESKVARTGIRLAERKGVRGAGRSVQRMTPYLCDLSVELNDLIRNGGRVLFEGAQGALLDVDHGTYPYVTSSNSTTGGAATGSGVPPMALDGAIGVVKAYTTRVGEGPMPTELFDDVGSHLRDRGHEFGTTTGRPRRCGWLDLVVLRHANRVNGARCLALTKIDVLDELDELQICVAYRIGGEIVRNLPAETSRLGTAEPIYRAFPGWKRDTRGVLNRSDLPRAARDYIAFLEQELEAVVDLISSGPRREETAVSGGGPLEEWLGERLPAVRSAVGR